MPALSDDIAAASRDVVTATWSSETIAARYPSARDGSVQPSEGFCDVVADAQAIVDARGALLGTERRRFSVSAADVIWPIVSTVMPTAALVDAEQGGTTNCLIARLELDLEAETTTYELFG